MFGADDPRLFDTKTVDRYPTEFARTYCGDGVTRQDCAKAIRPNRLFETLRALFRGGSRGYRQDLRDRTFDLR